MTTGNKNSKKAEKSKSRKVFFSISAVLLKFLFFVGFWAGLAAVGLVAYYSRDLPDTKKLLESPKAHSIRVLDRNGEFLTVIGGSGKNIAFRDLPPHLVQAVIATEDRRFFDHFGVDIFGLTRAMYANYRAGKVVQGGSTVTQQLAKLIFLTPERTIKRKIQEAMLAVWIERNFTKEEIMEMYLNRVYLGGGNYGIDSASKSYFGKGATELNLGESAIIAGLLKAPSRYSPHNNKELAEKRARQVLGKMVEAGYISSSEVAEKVNVLGTYTGQLNSSFYFTDWIASQITEYIGQLESNVTVLTTLDTKLQYFAEESIRTVLEQKSKELKVQQASLFSISPQGEVLAMVGGRDFKKSQFNRVTQAYRQPGSSFKLFIYLAGLENGYDQYSVFEDAPIEVGNWRPENYKNEYLGEIILKEALARSLNTVAVQLSEAVGREKVIEMAHRLGIEENILATPALALGTTEVTLLEMVQAYAHLANGGYRVRAYGIKEIKDDNNKILFKRSDYDPPRILEENTVLRMNDMLTQVMKVGTGRRANFGRSLAGKTGTSQEFRDAWIIAYTPQIVTGVWAGNDDNTSMKEVTGGTIPAEIFKAYMSIAHENLKAQDIPVDTSENPWDSATEENTEEDGSGNRNEREQFWDNIIEEVPPPASPESEQKWKQQNSEDGSLF